MLTTLLCLLLPFGADPVPQASPVKLEAALRSGYAIVSVSSTNEKLTIKQAEFIPVATSNAAKVTFDQFGDRLIVTLPPAGNVVIYAATVMSDGSLAVTNPIEVPPSTDTPTSPTTPTTPGTPTPSPSPAAPLAGETGLRVILAVNLAAPGKPEMDLVQMGSQTTESIKQALGGLGHSWHLADVNSAVFQQALAKARATTPTVPTTADVPFLFIEKAADRSFRAAFKLNLSQDPRANANAILALFGGKL